MIVRIIAFFKFISEVTAESRTLQTSMRQKYGWMSG
jgi:hypothetical protein